MKSQAIQYSDGSIGYVGHIVDPEPDKPVPGILIAHEGPGLNDNTRSKAEAVARLGYVAFAVDLYGGGVTASTPDQAVALMGPLRESPSELRKRIRTGLDVLTAQSNVDPQRLGAIGYCFGGMAVLELARSGAPIQATVCFHGLLGTTQPEDAKQIKGRVLVCAGSDDPFVPASQVEAFRKEMSEAGIDWQINIYGGAKHAFTNPYADKLNRPGLAYSSTADTRSWNAMQTIFSEVFRTAKGSVEFR